MKHFLVKPVLILLFLLLAGLAQAKFSSLPVSAQAQAVAILATKKTVVPPATPTEYPVVSHTAPTVSEATPTPIPVVTTKSTTTPVVATPASTASVSTPIPASKANAATAAPTVSATPTAKLVSLNFTVDDGQVYNGQGQAVTLHGVNWFGFDTASHTVHGLWQRNWQSMVTQIKATGFNAVRLPVCPASINGAAVTSGLIDYTQNPDLLGLNSQQILDKVVDAFNAEGVYVLIDLHSPDCQTISDLWYTPAYPESQWITDLQMVAGRYAALPYFLGIDLKNEPQGTATWGTGNLATDWNSAAERAGRAVLATNPNLLIFVEGIQESSTCSSTVPHFWGGNFEPAACTPLQLPANKTVYSPHVYGPDVYPQPYFSAANFPDNMPAIWQQQFGFLASTGKTIIPGEWGGKYGTENGNPSDVLWQNALVAYYEQNHICSSFYWSWNPNSSDTGGILEDDWQTVWPTKIALLDSYWNSCKAN